MVFNSSMVLAVANASADAWQRLACVPEERIASNQLLDLIFCFPLQGLRRLSLCLWTFFCFPAPDSYHSYPFYASDSSSDLDDDEDSDDGNRFFYDSHSD